jgi:hypothetical protein
MCSSLRLIRAVIRDLHDLFLLATEAYLCWMILLQTAQALRDKEFIAACTKLGGETEGQRSWLQTRIKQAAPQALLLTLDSMGAAGDI